MNPSSTVVAAVIVITTTTIIRRIREGKWESHILQTIVFGFLLMIALLTLAVVMPGFAKALAYLGLVGAFVLNGPSVFSYLGDFERTKPTGTREVKNVRRAAGSI